MAEQTREEVLAHLREQATPAIAARSQPQLDMVMVEFALSMQHSPVTEMDIAVTLADILTNQPHEVQRFWFGTCPCKGDICAFL